MGFELGLVVLLLLFILGIVSYRVFMIVVVVVAVVVVVVVLSLSLVLPSLCALLLVSPLLLSVGDVVVAIGVCYCCF